MQRATSAVSAMIGTVAVICTAVSSECRASATRSSTVALSQTASPRFASASRGPERLNLAPGFDPGPASDAARVSGLEYAAIGSLGAGLALAFTMTSPPQSPNWRGGLLFDDGVRGVLRAGSERSRERAGSISDLLHFSLIAYPVVGDALLGTALIKGDGGTALRMVADDAAAFLVTGVIVQTLKNTVGRERPYARDCVDCVNGGTNQSFASGHTAMAFTGAALMCSQHASLGVYGNKTADDGACIAGLALAGTTGALRIVADRHYATDVLAGAAIGLASGYLVPRAMNALFGKRGSSDEDSDGGGRGPRIVLAPQIGSDQVGLSLSIF